MSRNIVRWFVVGILILYGAYNLNFAFKLGHWAYWGLGGLATVSAIGLAFSKPWSQFLIYIISLVSVVWWLFVIWGVYQAGWPYDDMQRSVISLILGILLVILCLSSSWFVYTLFKNDAKKT